MAHLKNKRDVQKDLEHFRRWSAVGNRPERVRNASAPSGDTKSDSAAVDSSGTLATTSMDKNCDPAAVVSTVRRSLQRQVREREQRIAGLESQLETLKAIDRDAVKWSTFSRPPATLTPAATDQRR